MNSTNTSSNNLPFWVIPEQSSYGDELAQRFSLPAPQTLLSQHSVRPSGMILTADGLHISSENNITRFDLFSNTMRFRMRGQKRNESLAKAIKLKGIDKPRVIDATAGAGIDGVLMTHWGATVVLIEKNQYIAALLYDAIQRLKTQSPALYQNISFFHADAKIYLGVEQPDTTCADIVYLDPMFPHKSSSAKVKQTMLNIQWLAGPVDDQSNQDLLHAALSHARHRVIVKRPVKAPTLSAIKPDYAFEMKKHRFDIYLT